MNATAILQMRETATAPCERRPGKTRETGRSPDVHDDWLAPDGIGHVEKGSLEEEIWRELGALPASRRVGPGKR